MKGRTFVMGDIHGAYRALMQCLERSRFDYKRDVLICLGDVADGWPETRQSVEELMKLDNLIYLLGNHDFWTLQWFDTGFADDVWHSQGGEATMQSYNYKPLQDHADFFRSAKPYHLQDGQLFVHAGISTQKPIEQQSLQIFLWDRSLVRMAQDFHEKKITQKLTDYDEIYVGHTPVVDGEPQQFCEVWMMDTGAGWSGVLSMMDIDTKEFFVSDPVPGLYPGIAGRQKS